MKSSFTGEVLTGSQKDDVVAMDADEFKMNYESDQAEINRIFKHMIHKYPSQDGIPDAFNRLFVGLYELKVFQKWSVARVVRAEVKRRTDSAAKATRVYNRLMKAGNDEAERVALDMGINLKAKRGQFLYKWIEHIMGQEYHRDGLHMRRFGRIDSSMSYPTNWQSARRERGFIPWAAREKNADPEDHYAGSGAWGYAANHESKLFPMFDDTPTCIGEHTYSEALCSVDVGIREKEFMDAIHNGSKCHDRAIISKRLQGYSIREIQTHFNSRKGLPKYSHQAIANRLISLRSKPTTRKVAA